MIDEEIMSDSLIIWKVIVAHKFLTILAKGKLQCLVLSWRRWLVCWKMLIFSLDVNVCNCTHVKQGIVFWSMT